MNTKRILVRLGNKIEKRIYSDPSLKEYVHGQTLKLILNIDPIPLSRTNKPVYFDTFFFFYIITKTRLFKYIEKFITQNWKFSDKTSDIFYIYISAQNIDCEYSLELPRRCGSNEYPQSMFLSRNKKNNVYPCKPQFYYIKMGFKGVKTI